MSVKEQALVRERLYDLGIRFHEAQQLRRIALCLHNWFEAECGTDGRNGSTVSIERDDGDGKPFRRIQYQSATAGWIEDGWSIEKAILTSDWLKGRDCWQAACDAK